MKKLKRYFWLFLLLPFNLAAHPGHDAGMMHGLSEILLSNGLIGVLLLVSLVLLPLKLKKDKSIQQRKKSK